MNRFAEPSTWAGLAALFQVAKSFLPPQHAIYADGASVIAGALAGMIQEKGKVS